MKCKECRWFESQHIESDFFDCKTETSSFIEVGICRKYPPHQFVFPNTGNTSYRWPSTRGCDWCGEWENITPSELTLEMRTVQVLKDWLSAQDGKPMPRWKLRRSVARDNEAELAPALERLVENGSLEIVLIQTKGRPFSGCKLT